MQVQRSELAQFFEVYQPGVSNRGAIPEFPSLNVGKRFQMYQVRVCCLTLQYAKAHGLHRAEVMFTESVPQPFRPSEFELHVPAAVVNCSNRPLLRPVRLCQEPRNEYQSSD
jgi:hypothetical protein